MNSRVMRTVDSKSSCIVWANKERRSCIKNVTGIEQCPLKIEIRRDHFKINMMNHRKARILKTTSLVTLTLQNSILGLSLRYARTRPGDLFLSTTAVFMSEIIKLAICLIILLFEEGSIRQLLATLNNVVIKQPIDTLKVCVPSFVYIIQNNLLFISASHLDAATYQVTYQLKILTTAVFAVLMLKRTLPLQQWVALIVLVLGVVLVQLTGSSDNTKNTEIVQNKLIGFSAALTACVLSGFAGIYFEMILKGSDISVWMRNVQLSFLSLPFGLVTCFVKDWEKITQKGFFHSYDSFVVFVVFLQAGGGLIVAMVVKYADNILKGFATSLAIILSCIASVYLFDFVITVQFIIGAGLVIASIFLYNVKPKAKTKIPRESADVTENLNIQRV